LPKRKMGGTPVAPEKRKKEKMEGVKKKTF